MLTGAGAGLGFSETCHGLESRTGPSGGGDPALCAVVVTVAIPDPELVARDTTSSGGTWAALLLLWSQTEATSQGGPEPGTLCRQLSSVLPMPDK